MKRIFVFILSVLIIVGSNFAVAACAKVALNNVKSFDDKEQELCDKLIFVQTIADSNNDYSQYIKYEVADTVCGYLNNMFEAYGVSDHSTAVNLLKNNISTIEVLCLKKMQDENCFSTVSVELVESGCKEIYPSSIVNTAEKFDYLRIKIGSGHGSNCKNVVWLAAGVQDTVVENCMTEKEYVIEKEHTIDKEYAIDKEHVIEKEYVVSKSIFPPEVKIDIWIVGAIKKLIARLA